MSLASIDALYFEFTPYALPTLFGAAILLPTASYAWRRRATLGAVPIALLLLAQAEWMIAASLEALGGDLATTVAMGKLAFLGGLPATLRARGRIQAARTVPDRDLLVGGPLTVAPHLLAGGASRAVLGLLDAALRLWWRLVRPLAG